MCKKCVTDETAAKIEWVYRVANEWSDGAFLAFCEERGVDATDIEAYFKKHKEEVK